MSSPQQPWVERYTTKVEMLYKVVQVTGHEYDVVESLVKEMCARTGRPEMEVVQIMYGRAMDTV